MKCPMCGSRMRKIGDDWFHSVKGGCPVWFVKGTDRSVYATPKYAEERRKKLQGMM